MAKSKDINFIEFVMDSKQRGVSQRQMAKDWTELTGESCDRGTIGIVLQENNPIEWLAKKQGASLKDVSGVYVRGDGSMSLRIKFNNKIVSYNEVKDEIIGDMKKYAPKYPIIKRKKLKDPYLLVVNPADIHIGKLGVNGYNVDVAIQRVREGVQGILNEYQHKNIEKIVFVGGNDILHTEGASKKTTRGTLQDTDGTWHKNFQLARMLYVEILEQLIAIADVEFVFCPSNHDYATGFMLCDSVASWFNKSKNIKFDISMSPRKYVSYGKNLLGFTHGDGAKPQDLPLLMANESEYRAIDQKRFIYGHHVHHKIAKDYIGVCFETARSASGTDTRHNEEGYKGAPQAIEGFLHAKDGRNNGRFTFVF